MVVAILYLCCFLLGAAAFACQAVWTRSLTLTFGASQAVVVGVLSVFLGGLAMGAYVFGKRSDHATQPVRLYGTLALGTAASALLVGVFMSLLPAIAAVLVILPAMLMGGMLPVASRALAAEPQNSHRHFPFLLGIQAIGAVTGAAAVSFLGLRGYSVNALLYAAVCTTALVGVGSLVLQSRLGESASQPAGDPMAEVSAGPGRAHERLHGADIRWLLWGAAAGSLCAAGCQVLLARILTLVVGAGVYGSTLLAVALLSGIGLGSLAYGLVARFRRTDSIRASRTVVWFALTQLLVGSTALLVTIWLGDLPLNAARVHGYLAGSGLAPASARMWADIALAFCAMAVPAACMGAALPMVGEALAQHRHSTGRGAGEAFAVTLAGAILGTATAGLLLGPAAGIERSLQILAIGNMGLGLTVLGGIQRRRALAGVAASAAVAAAALLILSPELGRTWDRARFAIFRTSQLDAFRTPQLIAEATENTDVLYYAEGTQAIVSVIKIKGGEYALITNGRLGAWTHAQTRQAPLALGHVPVLLTGNPKDVLVVGLGAGMTAGATGLHPRVETVTVVETEPRVVGAAKALEAYNHHVTDNAKVRVVFSDPRAYLRTTNQQFDVITTDPSHPRVRGASSRYASEYFALAARHLKPGGVIAQSLPLHELATSDLASMTRTFLQHFPHAMLWLTHADALILGSNTPFRIDEAQLERRVTDPSVSGDLRSMTMGSAADLLSYFVMGRSGMEQLAGSAVLNTDNRPYVEYTAAFSIAAWTAAAENVEALSAQREGILPYLTPGSDSADIRAQEERWGLHEVAGKMGDRALGLFLRQGPTDPSVTMVMRQLTLEHPTYAPGRALWIEHQAMAALEPRLLSRETFHLLADKGAIFIEMSAVLVPVSRTRAAVMFVDNRSRTIYGQAYMDDYERDDRAATFASDVMSALRNAYEKLASAAKEQHGGLPAAPAAQQSIRAIIESKVTGVRSKS